MNDLAQHIITFLVVTTFSIYIYLVWNFNYWKKRGVKGPKPKIVYGNIQNSYKMITNLCYEFDGIYRAYKNDEKFAGIFVGRCPQMLLIDPKVIREVLVANFKSFHDNEISLITTDRRDPLIARNPFLSVGAAWKEKRAEVTPALTSSRIKANYPVMLNVCKSLTKFLEKQLQNPRREGIEARELATRFTSDVVANSIYGIEAGAFDEEECRIVEEGNSFTIFAMPYYFLLSAFPFLKHFYKYKLVPKHTEQFFIKLTNDAMNLKKDSVDSRIDFLSYLLQIKVKKNLTNLDITAHTVTFFLDGFDTSAIAISHCLHMLARHKEVQEKLRDEINNALSKDGNISFEKLTELPYLDQVFSETLRLFPPLMILTKLCTQKHEFINSKDKVISVEKDTVLIIPTYSIHRDERYYPDPAKFIPERFNPENGGAKKYKDMGVFLPFGDGPRVFLGMRFGLAQSKAAVVELISNWEMSVNENTKEDYSADPTKFLFVIEGGIWLNFKRIWK